MLSPLSVSSPCSDKVSVRQRAKTAVKVENKAGNGLCELELWALMVPAAAPSPPLVQQLQRGLYLRICCLFLCLVCESGTVCCHPWVHNPSHVPWATKTGWPVAFVFPGLAKQSTLYIVLEMGKLPSHKLMTEANESPQSPSI